MVATGSFILANNYSKVANRSIDVAKACIMVAIGTFILANAHIELAVACIMLNPSTTLRKTGL